MKKKWRSNCKLKGSLARVSKLRFVSEYRFLHSVRLHLYMPLALGSFFAMFIARSCFIRASFLFRNVSRPLVHVPFYICQNVNRKEMLCFFLKHKIWPYHLVCRSPWAVFAMFITRLLVLVWSSNYFLAVVLTDYCTYTQRNISGILLNKTGIRLYLPCTDWFGTRRTFAWFKINRCMVNTILFGFDSIWFRKDISVWADG